MSFLTVPPPFDDDHEDVAWALRAASAQWKREAHQDAIHWVRRASETAKELGASGRAAELSRLAQALSNASMPAVAPPPPPAAIAPPPWASAASHRPSGPASVDYEIVDVDVELDEEIEELDDNDEIELLDDEGVETVEAIETIEEFEDASVRLPELASVPDQPSPISLAASFPVAASAPSAASLAGDLNASATAHGYRPVPPPSLPPGVSAAHPARGRRSASDPPPFSSPSTPPSSRSVPPPSLPPSAEELDASPISESAPSPRSSRPSKRRNSSRAAAPRPSTRPSATGTRRATADGSSTETSLTRPERQPVTPQRSRAGRTTTSPKLDRLPPSMRPVPSGLDLDEEAENELNLDGLPSRSRKSEGEEFDELFGEEAKTNRLDSDFPPPIPDLGPLSLEGSPVVPIEEQTAAEYAQLRDRVQHDHDALERELGVDLSVRGVRSPPVQAPSLLETRASFLAPEDDSEAQRISNYPSSFPGGVVSGLPTPPSLDLDPQIPELEVGATSPIPGRASSRPSPASMLASPRTTSAPAEPYALAPSAAMPAVATSGPRIEPPSRPTHAPPPSSMADPGLGYSPIPEPTLTEASYPDIPPTSAAPDADEFEELFAKISVPPAARTVTSEPLYQDAPGFDADFDEDKEGPRSVPAQPIRGADGEVLVDGLDLMEVDGFQDLPEDSALGLAQRAELRTLLVREEVNGFGLAIVTQGSVALMPASVDAICRIARKGEVISTRGTLADAISLRLVGLEEGSRIAVFSSSDLDAATISCPWVADELSAIADTYLAFAGAVLGPLGRSLDEMFRFMVLDKCSVKRKSAGDLIATGGKAMDGMYILGAGTLEVLGHDGVVMTRIAPGEFVFPDTVFSAAPAEHTVRAGQEGALLLYAPRMATHELLATCPPFIELLAR